ncbi:uncharacterized protein LMH87_009141 [Akanthomyces muscarius]|uniref:Endosomal peripheral membrane protein n=1 Tax=Akanthomyces muscarius TaxID=2231603 RepID=A0A9W8QIL4_AKAMU|nr:uncharacterized protein LMH87_009141 [Akanthomyces muscarius]KAJ4158623.1 hypothetical protein LMH87_009141 [Akanthomyces muscarius]
MTTQLLATELANLIQESKRKHNDLRQAAEKSLEDLKQLGSISESAVSDHLSQRTSFVNPFIIACGTKNAKFTSIAIVCLQRLIVARALPRSKLNQVLEALMQASSAALDVQLKILQALPSLLQNYAAELQGELLVTTLNICFILQSSKNAIVNNTSAATLQQLVVAVFDKVVTEDKNGSNQPFVGEAATADGKVQLRTAALDAYRIFNDLCLLTENQRPEYMRFAGLPQTFGLELIESVITNHGNLLAAHPEQVQVLRVRVMPLLVSGLKGKPTFSTSVRLVRILYTLLRRHISLLPVECGEALGILTHLMDQDSSLWKRALCMEVFRGLFAEHSLIREIYALYDAKEGQKDIFKALVAIFVRLGTEKPAVIGLSHQSTIPASDNRDGQDASDQAVLEASGVSGIMSGTSGAESSHVGINSRWSTIRIPCIDQLDKTEPPPIPETYVYSLILACISSLSDGLAKFILPLTVSGDNKGRRKISPQELDSDSPKPQQLEAENHPTRTRTERSSSFKKNPIPINPLTLESHPLHSEVMICSSIVDECWPAILATCSNFLYASLDSEYYHGLVRAFQRFAHVAGLLQLATPRDAFLTTLGKSAVPPNVLTACLNAGQSRPLTPAAAPESPASSILSNARGLLSVETLQSPQATEKQRQVNADMASASLNTRNLLCLRALLNLGIALGPTLGTSWSIILETLQQADLVLFSTSKGSLRSPSMSRAPDQGSESENSSLMANFSNEVRSVETAASRLLESTIDFPDEQFTQVVQAICGLLAVQLSTDSTPAQPQAKEPLKPGQRPGQGHRRALSFANQTITGTNQELLFALAKLGEIASINSERLLTSDPAKSGWDLLVTQLSTTLDSTTLSAPVRTRAAEVLARFMLESGSMAASLSEDLRGPIQLRLLVGLRESLAALQKKKREDSVAGNATDLEIHRIILEGLRQILENYGESLVEGWDVAFEIIGSVFVAKDTISEQGRESSKPIGTRSSKLVRSAFGSLQLICSDFLASLPNNCFLILVDALYNFSSQDDDLNIALTTVTFFWILSDFLSSRSKSLEITEELMKDVDSTSLAKLASNSEDQNSSAALWLLLLQRLTAVSSDTRLELRNSAIQTLLRIFDAYGDRLTPEAWSMCIRSVLFRLLSSLEDELESTSEDETDGNRNEWHDTSVVALDGISTLLANYLDALTAHSSFNELWKELLTHFATLLDFKVLAINTAAFKALALILSQANEEQKANLNEDAVDLAWELWARGVPAAVVSEGKGEDNQGCLIAYVAALTELYQLIQENLTVKRVERILTLLHLSAQEASYGSFASDLDNLTQLQSKIMAAVKMIRTDVEGIPSAMLSYGSKLVTLAFEQESTREKKPKRTFVALSRASISCLEIVALKHAADKDIYASGSLATALVALCKPIALKYGFPLTTKAVQPWRVATSSALAILEATLPQLKDLHVPKETAQHIWFNVASLGDSILSADCDDAAAGTNFAADEEFDIASFKHLRDMIIPDLGAEDVPDQARKALASSLFKTSIIHAPTDADYEIINGESEAGLSALYETRTGQTVFVPPTCRTKIAYVAFEELFTLVAEEHADQPPITKSKPTKKGMAAKDDASLSMSIRARIASSVAPFFILRCALALRAYVADQPLRGKMPQPVSQRRELLWTLRRLVDLRSESDAIPALNGAQSTSRKHLLRLYPLLVKGLVAGGDEKVLELLREALDVIGGELGIA